MDSFQYISMFSDKLATVYINDYEKFSLKSTNPHYGDDTALLCWGKSQEDLQNNLLLVWESKFFERMA